VQWDLALPCVVHEELGDLTEGPTLLPKVYNDTHATFLRCANAFLNSVDQVGPASADVGAKHVGSAARNSSSLRWSTK
jgi:hypothetical protein